jgi:hypothetical protein
MAMVEPAKHPGRHRVVRRRAALEQPRAVVAEPLEPAILQRVRIVSTMRASTSAASARTASRKARRWRKIESAQGERSAA